MSVTDVAARRIASRVVGGERKSKGTVRVTLRNDGDETLRGPVTVKLFSSTDGTVGPSDLALAEVTKRVRIRAGATKTLSVKVKIPRPAADGDYFFIADLAGGDGVRVSRAQAKSAAAVRIEKPVVRLDAGVHSAPQNGSPTDVELGERLRLAVPVANRGNVAAKGKVDVELFASRDGALTGATRIATASGQSVSLRADRSKSLKLKFDIPDSAAALPSGAQVLLVRLTATGDLGDLNTTDGAIVARVPFVVV